MSRDNINHTFHRAVIFIFWLRSCVCTSSELHGWVPAGWFWDIQGRGKKSYDQEAGKTIKAVWSHENWIVHSTNIKMIVYCPYNWARSAAAVPVWVDHLQAVFGALLAAAQPAVATVARPALLPLLLWLLFFLSSLAHSSGSLVWFLSQESDYLLWVC